MLFGIKLIEDMCVETLMWGSDYPHPDGVWPESAKYIEDQFSHPPAEIVHKMTCENAGKWGRRTIAVTPCARAGALPPGTGCRQERGGLARDHAQHIAACAAETAG